MKYLLQIGFYLLISLLFLSQACTSKGPNTKVDVTGGYKNLKLDAPYDSIKTLVELNLTVNNPCTATKKFETTAEPYTSLSTINFEKVDLEFVRDSLYRVRLYSQYTYPVDRKLHELFRAKFGEPSEARETLSGIKYTTYKWTGSNIYIHITQRDHSDLEIEYGSFKGEKRSQDEEKKCSQRTL